MSSTDANTTAPANGTKDLAQSFNGTDARSAAAPGIMGLIAQGDFVFLTAQITLSAMAIIWLGANSSLRRPPSASPAKRSRGTRSEDGDDEDEDEEKFTEGFVASDAIMFPLLAGTVLIGLYYLLKWLQDPDILNKILRAYMSVMSVASLGKLVADALHLLTTLAFPSVWSDQRGRVYRIDPSRRRHLLLGEGGDDAAGAPVDDKRSPFPGPLSRVAFSQRTNKALWEIRHLLMEKWTVRMALHGVGSGRVSIKLNDIFGFMLAVLITMAYYLTGWFWLSNILGSAFCYTAFSLMSPTSFAIGTMVLAGLFVYDIVMVFYTPYMVTVATKLDVPIKLVFQGASRSSILGLGDIVIPGIFIGLALRFDLWRHYNKQVKQVPTELKSEYVGETPGQATTATTTTQTQYRAVKALYVDPRGRWGDRIWTTSSLGSLFSAPTATPALAATAFSKVYFYSSMAGYAVGMLLTLIMLLFFEHGQPALLYLVPCVTGFAWLAGAVRGEISDMWRYTEDGSLDTQDVIVEVDGAGKVIKETGEKKGSKGEDGKGSTSSAGDSTVADGPAIGKAQGQTANGRPRKGSGASDTGEGYDVFLFSITAPPPESLKED